MESDELMMVLQLFHDMDAPCLLVSFKSQVSTARPGISAGTINGAPPVSEVSCGISDSPFSFFIRLDNLSLPFCRQMIGNFSCNLATEYILTPSGRSISGPGWRVFFPGLIIT